ncbi:hypothetical protein GPL21_30525 [Bradyrhizobium pachyrhizi]|uniref:Uncharacterized protein n=1 Tax=Bradyrhizobium pachyrhizi TaxID=280333 RepID=A0A844STY8_9BRAD|nr:hypothetical protein [Bradyrhizobium pachyrhizi]MVT69436.1 hypothetical protein [Bradyrhizobium pachyrhizi]
MRTAARRRAPEYTATQLNKVEPIGGGLIRLHFSVAADASWDTQCTIIMPLTSIDGALGFAVDAARQIAHADASDVQLVPHLGKVN